MIRTVDTHSCYLCGEKGNILYSDMEDNSFGVKGKWNLRQCQNSGCNMIWVDPMPVEEDIFKLYEKYYTHAAFTYSKPFAWFLKNIRSGILSTRIGYKSKDAVRNFFGYLFSFNPDLYDLVAGGVMWLKPIPQGRLLDIGCGNGKFLDRMRSLNWLVDGIDPDAEAVKAAKKLYDLNIKQGTLLEVKYPDNTFDAVTMNHVIEHTPDPIQTLKEIKRILKSGGKLIISTTNSQSWGHRHYKNDWEGLDLPRHLYIYNCQSLKTLVEKAGLTVTEVRTSGRLGMYFLGLSHFRKKSRHKNRILPHPELFKNMQKNIFTYLIWERFVGNRKKKSQEEVVLIARN